MPVRPNSALTHVESNDVTTNIAAKMPAALSSSGFWLTGLRSASVGDGTSTSTILAYAILADGVRNVVAGASAIDLKRGLDRAMKAAVDTLKAMSRPIKTRKEKAQVATISAHNNKSIGELVADAME